MGIDLGRQECDGDAFARDLANNDALSKATRRKILWDNPARLYGIESLSSTE